MSLEVLYEDNHIIVVNKRPGDITQGDKTGDAPLSDFVKAYIKKKYNKPGNVFLGTIHRLDRPTSGIVVYARTSKGLTRMNALFQKKEIKKTYWAVVEQKPKSAKGNLIDFLKKNEKQNKSYIVDESTNGAKKAELSYSYLGSSDKYHLLEVDLGTGRHHQIRTQLANIGCIIKGDLKYGAKRSNKDASIHLHSRKISFVHPVSKEVIEIIAPPPKDPVWDYFLRD